MEIDFRPSEDLYPFESRWFESSVGTVHYIDEGSGRPILFGHGNLTWSFLYRNVVTGLRDRYRCVAVDLPGFGLSVRPEGYGYTPGEHSAVLGELVDSLELTDLVMMGHDWGGPTSLSVAADRAERVSGVVLANTFFWPGNEHLMFRVFSKAMSTGFAQRQILERNAFVERALPRLATTKLSDEVMDHYRAVQPSPEARLGLAEAPRQILEASPWLAELFQKVQSDLGSKAALLVWGMKDLFFRPKAFIPRIQATFPDHQVIQLPQANHYIQEDAPNEIAAAIIDRFSTD